MFYTKAPLKATFIASAAAGALAAAAALSGCKSSEKGRLDYQASIDAAQAIQEDKAAILFMSNQLFSWPILQDPAHNGLMFAAPKDAFGATINANAIDRKTGSYSPNGDNGDGLFVTDSYAINNRDLMITEIYVGSFDDVIKKYRIALDAAFFINMQNLVYDQFEILGTAQNSNSVAYTLLKAMGLEMPERHEKYMLPGHGRLLLPRSWRSAYEDWEPPVKDRNFQIWHAQQLYERVTMAAHAHHSIRPDPGRRIFFDPDKPFVPYQPLIMPDPVQRWEDQMKREAARAEYERQAAARAREAAQRERKIMESTAYSDMSEYELRP